MRVQLACITLLSVLSGGALYLTAVAFGDEDRLTPAAHSIHR